MAVYKNVVFIVLMTLMFMQCFGQGNLPGKEQDQVEKFQEAFIRNKDNPSRAAEFANKIAYIYWNHNHLDSAKKYFAWSVDINKKLDNLNALKTLHYNLGLIASDQNKYKEALEYIERGLLYARELKNKQYILNGLVNKAQLLQQMGKVNEALSVSKTALPVAKELQDYTALRANYMVLSEAYQKSGKTEIAMQYFDSLSAVKRLMVEREMSELENEVFKEKTERKRHESELKEAAEKLDEVKDSLMISEKMNKQKSMQLKIKELQISKQRMELQQERRIRYLLLLIVLLVLVFTFILYRQNQRIKKANRKLVEKNNQINRQKEQIEKQKHQLEEKNEALEKSEKELKISNATKDKFFSILAHDLKNPFNALHGLTSFLLYKFDKYSRDDLKSKIEMINQSAEQLIKLLENLLQWSRSQSGKMKFKPREIHLAELVENNFMLLKVNAEKKNIVLSSTVDEKVKIFGDYDMLNAVLRNLISNAIKFTLEGEITVDYKEREDEHLIAVKDTGVGVSKEEQDKLFRIDTHVSRKGTHKEEGTGLGLILCKEFINRHKGEIWVESEVDKGSTFYFTVPKASEENNKQ